MQQLWSKVMREIEWSKTLKRVWMGLTDNWQMGIFFSSIDFCRIRSKDHEQWLQVKIGRSGQK
jgi:hypothetical protein